MDEFRIVSNLLKDPKQIQFLDVSPEWFTQEQMGIVVKGVKELNGEYKSTLDLAEKLKELGNQTSFDELEMLKELPDTDKYSFADMVPYLHREHVQKMLNTYMAKFQTEGTKANLKMVADLTEEFESIQEVDDSGLLETSLLAFKKELFSDEKTSIETFSDISRMIGGGFRPGQLITIGARSGVGKTLVSLNFLADFLERNENFRGDFFSLEMTKFEIVDRLISRKAHINSLKLVDYTNLNPEEKEKVLDCYQELSQKYDMGIFGEQFQTLGIIKRKIRQRRAETNGKYAVFIDYAGLINVEGVSNGGDSAGRIKMNIITRELKLLATELRCTIFLLAQLNRGLEYRQDKTPGLQDLKESGSLEQDSSMVFFISKDNEEENLAFLDVAKNRVGMKGRIKFYMNPTFMEFKPYTEEYA